MPAITYFQLLNEAMRLYREGMLVQAYDMITEHADAVSGNPAQLLNFRYSIASKLGKMDLAIGLMREAIIDKGYWYGHEYLLEDEDLKPLRDLPEFQRLAAICKTREAEAKENSRPAMKIVRAHEDGQARKVLMALHGNGDSIEVNGPYWMPCLRLGFDLALPQSSQITFWGGYAWDDLDRGLAELTGHLGSIESSTTAEQNDIVLAGFSAGARLALYAVLKGAASPDGLILVAPWLPELESWEGQLRSIAGTGIECWIICGDADGDCYEGSMTLASMMEKKGIRAHLEIIKGLDHDFPADFESRLPRMLGD